MEKERFIPAKRQAADGRVWWCIIDRKRGNGQLILATGNTKRAKMRNIRLTNIAESGHYLRQFENRQTARKS